MSNALTPGAIVKCVAGDHPSRSIPIRGSRYVVKSIVPLDGIKPLVEIEGFPGLWSSERFVREEPYRVIPTSSDFDGLATPGALRQPMFVPVEQDPNGIEQHEPGAKLDAGKPRAGLLLDFGNALAAVAEVATYGADKYTEGGWQHVPDGEKRYRDAGIRHRLAEANESHDSQSGLSHLAHAAWNILAELELRIRRANEQD